MILVDTSVWIDHLRSNNAALAALLDGGRVLAHPWVIGELALGGLRDTRGALSLLHRLPMAPVASDNEILEMIHAESLSGTGVGYVDVQLLASTRLTPDARLWTLDRPLERVAQRLHVAS